MFCSFEEIFPIARSKRSTCVKFILGFGDKNETKPSHVKDFYSQLLKEYV